MVSTHEDSKVNEAARWLSQQSNQPANVIHEIRTQFELSAWQACEACRVAQNIRRGVVANA